MTGPKWDDPISAVSHLGAVQAQDLPGSLLSVALRLASPSAEKLRAAFDTGQVVRSWPMRGTLHLVPAIDLGWMLSLTRARMVSGAATRRRDVGITDQVLANARDLALTALDGGGALPRKELFEIWRSAGLLVHSQTGVHLLGLLCQQTVLVLGPLAGREQLVVSYADWIPQPRHLDRPEALAELARRYVRSHGPATVADLARWASLTITEARAAVAAVRDEFATLHIDGSEHLHEPGLIERWHAHRDEVAQLRLLPGFDEFILGYRDRSFAVADEHASRLVPGNNGMFRASIVIDGHVVGVWRRGGTPKKPTIIAEGFQPLTDAELAAAQTAFLALPPIS
ncbi:MAG: winged helix DNA-binding domain-containing protein [Propionibacteriales bacterium]|nr:winged helix DNA-binding domain-containing protein [Propionibacteriales bacterium]